MKLEPKIKLADFATKAYSSDPILKTDLTLLSTPPLITQSYSKREQSQTLTQETIDMSKKIKR